MELPRRKFLPLVAGAAARSAVTGVICGDLNRGAEPGPPRHPAHGS